MNDFLLIIYALPLAIIGFLFEAYPRFINRYCGVDIWTHLLYLQEYHKQKGIPKKIEKGFLIFGVYDYPPAFIFIMSKFPIKYVKQYEFLFSPFFDALFMMIIFFISYFLTGNLVVSLLTQLLYLLTPIIVLENSSATPRSLGYTLFMLVFLSLFFFEKTGDVYLLIFSVIAGSLIFLSHRFTTQSFLFFSLFFSIITNSLLYIGVFLISFLLAVIFSKGFYLKVLKGHLGNLRFWRNVIAYRFAHQVRGIKKQHQTTDFVFRLYNGFLLFPPFVLAITNPWMLSAFLFSFFFSTQNILIFRLEQLVMFSYILALTTTWIPSLRFLGEGQRYLELSAFPAAFLSALFLQEFLTNTTIIAAYTIVGILALITIVVIQHKAIIKDRLRTLTPELQQMFQYLKSLKKKPKLLVIPHQMTTSTIYHTGCPVFVNADYVSIEKISDVYPFLKKPIKQIMKEHDLDAILLNEEYAKREELKFKKYVVLKQVKQYLLIKLS